MSSSLRTMLLFHAALGCGAAMVAAAAPSAFSQTPGARPQGAAVDTSKGVAIKEDESLTWDTTFADRSGGAPLHFVAEYTDARGPHRLEEWRTGLTHLRRRTDDRIDLHADVVGNPVPGRANEYLWQIIDIPRKIDNRISSAAMMHAGLFYSFYSMSHVLSRPAGKFTTAVLLSEPPVKLAGASCQWIELAPSDQPASRICWSQDLGIPLEIRTRHAGGAWTADFRLKSFDRSAIAPSVFAINLAGLQVHDHDAMVDDD